MLGLKPARGYSPRGRLKGRMGLGLVARSSRESGTGHDDGARVRQRSGSLTGDAIAAGRRQGVAGEHQWDFRVAPSKVGSAVLTRTAARR
jgi:hypothetical protein